VARFTTGELLRFHRAITVLPWGCWRAVKRVAKLPHSLVQIQLFADAYLQVLRQIA
jgi:hypothetical protein